MLSPEKPRLELGISKKLGMVSKIPHCASDATQLVTLLHYYVSASAMETC